VRAQESVLVFILEVIKTARKSPTKESTAIMSASRDRRDTASLEAYPTDRGVRTGAKATKPEALYAWNEKADRLAVGSFGSVYKAAPKRLRSYEHVHVAPSADAIKVVGTRRMAKSERIKLHREFEILRTLKHAHIVQFLEIFEEKSRLTLVFELMEGGRLDVRLRDSGGRLCEAEALATLKTLCLALDDLHRDMHIVHRDLKPENLLYASRAREFGSKFALRPLPPLPPACGAATDGVATVGAATGEIDEDDSTCASGDCPAAAVPGILPLCIPSE